MLSQKLEEQLEKSQGQVKVLSSEKMELEHKERDSRLQLEEVKRERDSLVTSRTKASEDLKAKNLELKKAKEVRLLGTIVLLAGRGWSSLLWATKYFDCS